jgi:hypothetical protein
MRLRAWQVGVVLGFALAAPALAVPALARAATCGPYWKATPGSAVGASGFTAVDALSASDVWAVGRSSSAAGAVSPVTRIGDQGPITPCYESVTRPPGFGPVGRITVSVV